MPIIAADYLIRKKRLPTSRELIDEAKTFKGEVIAFLRKLRS